jgi:hypothetical protein
MRKPIFADEAPIAEIRGGLAYLTHPGDKRPSVAVPIHVLREFCERSIRMLNDWERERAGVVEPIHKPSGKTGPITHG